MTADPVFVLREDILELHQESIEKFGGTHGLGDEGLFDSAINQPVNTYLYSDADLFDLAAAYAYHIAQAQAFLDGNKRTAVSAAVAFLQLNGISANFDSKEVYHAMIAIAEHRMDKPGLAALFRRITQPC